MQEKQGGLDSLGERSNSSASTTEESKGTFSTTGDSSHQSGVEDLQDIVNRGSRNVSFVSSRSDNPSFTSLPDENPQEILKAGSDRNSSELSEEEITETSSSLQPDAELENQTPDNEGLAGRAFNDSWTGFQ